MGLSVVIITKNEAHIIGATLQSLQGVTDNIVIVDSGSTDDTIPISKQFKANIIETEWQGYGETKNKGIEAAAHDWILSLDADEAIDEELRLSLSELDLSDENTVYEFKFKSFFGNRRIRHGDWAADKKTRLFNRTKVRWNNAAVHERLILPAGIKKHTVKGNVLHYTVLNLDEYFEKTIRYAKLTAMKYYLQGKKPAFIKSYLGPIFSFLKHYIFQLGFRDGYEGYIIAKTSAWYIFMKYAYLREYYKANKSSD